MLEREVVIPVSPETLWDALTEPDAVAGWFGAQVEWDLAPGGPAHFRQDDGEDRTGVVESVSPGRHLRFRWWPTGEEAGASEVTYDLEPAEDGTRLTITERRALEAPGEPATQNGSGSPVACARSGRPPGEVRPGVERWTGWDGRMVGLWGMADLRACAAA